MKSVELRRKRKELIEQERAILNKAETEKRELLAEEQEQYDRIDAEVDKLDGQIGKVEKLEEREKSINEPVTEKRVSGAGVNSAQSDEEFRSKAFSKFFLEGREALTREEARALAANTGSTGGYLQAPDAFVTELLKNVDDLVYIRQKARKFQVTSGQTLGVPSLEGRATAAIRGGEAATPTENLGITFGRRELKPMELMSLHKISEKLLRASVLPIDQIIRDEIAYSYAITEEIEFMTGSGAGQALGLFTASTDGISTARDVSTDNTTTAPTFDGLINAQESVKEVYQAKCEWIGSRALAKVLRKIKDLNGLYIWEESGKVGSPSLLLGKPYTRSEYCPQTFTTGLYVAIYGDLSNYWIADALSLQVKELNELYAGTFQKGYRCLSEMDGAPVREEAFARVKLA